MPELLYQNEKDRPFPPSSLLTIEYCCPELGGSPIFTHASTVKSPVIDSDGESGAEKYWLEERTSVAAWVLAAWDSPGSRNEKKISTANAHRTEPIEPRKNAESAKQKFLAPPPLRSLRSLAASRSAWFPIGAALSEGVMLAVFMRGG